MSRKKERKIKRLQHVTVWPTILGMIITLIVIFVMTTFICAVAFSGLVNSTLINSIKECKKVVQTVNENWNKSSRANIESKLLNFEDVYDDVFRIYIDDKNDFISIFPDLKDSMTDEKWNNLKNNGMIFFIEPGYKLNLEVENMYVSLESDFQNSSSSDSDEQNYKWKLTPKNLFKSINILYILENENFLSWSKNELPVLPVIAIFKTDIPNVNVCFSLSYKINILQSNLVIIIVGFLLIIFVTSAVFEIFKVIRLVQEKQQINKLIATDTITGGKNKDYFIQKAKSLVKKSRKNYSIVQLKLEKYKNFCTAFGVKQGENLLEQINSTLEIFLSKKEIVAHGSGANFILLIFSQNPETVNSRIKNLMNILQERQKDRHLYFSAGVCPVKKHDEIASAIAYAELAIPRQANLQNEIGWFTTEMKENQVWERHIEDDMEKALINREFQVYLQPKYSTKQEVLSAAEALVRWTHPTLGFISPGKFIPLFEKNGFILQLDDYMLTEVCRLQSSWASQGKNLIPISVNVSRAHFAEDNLAEHICTIVDIFKVPHEYIELELTESAFFDDKETLLTTIRKLKSFGFKVSMDDFGAGYSSLNSLKELPLDIIKLDGEFFRSVDDLQRSNLIVSETITLAKKLGMKIVAEGIETREQVDFLAMQNCDLIQGFYFSKPLPVNEFEERAYSKKGK